MWRLTWAQSKTTGPFRATFLRSCLIRNADEDPQSGTAFPSPIAVGAGGRGVRADFGNAPVIIRVP
jgi:hypothetical protein